MMVNQGETGSTTVGPSVRAIYDALFGIRGGVVYPERSVLVGGAPNPNLPTIKPDGTVVVAPRAVVPRRAATKPRAVAGATGATGATGSAKAKAP
jgi:hypothetical protein